MHLSRYWHSYQSSLDTWKANKPEVKSFIEQMVKKNSEKILEWSALTHFFFCFNNWIIMYLRCRLSTSQCYLSRFTEPLSICYATTSIAVGLYFFFRLFFFFASFTTQRKSGKFFFNGQTVFSVLRPLLGFAVWDIFRGARN